MTLILLPYTSAESDSNKETVEKKSKKKDKNVITFGIDPILNKYQENLDL
mgnify:CR=1 FL=1